MIKKLLIQRLNLQLLAEGGSGASTGDGGTVGGDTSVTGANAVSQTKTKGVKNNPLADVKYGIQPKENAQVTDVQEKEAAVAPVDRNAEFEKLIKGEYKDLYDARMQDTIRSRLKGTKEIVDKYNALIPTLEVLAQKHGVDVNNIEALNKAIQDDDSYFEEEALEKGMSVETLKEIKAMKRENEELKRQESERRNQENRDRTYAMWIEQAKQAQQFYPSLNISEEAKNPQFLSLLNAGIDVKTAFEVIHKDEMIPAAMQYTAKTVEEKIVNSIRANGTRPVENGMSSQSAATVKRNVSDLTKADRLEIERRVRNGEKISFG